jgi:hypothetical protein
MDNLTTVEPPTANPNYVDQIETVIASMAADDSAMVNRSGSSVLWKFRYGTVDVFVQLTGSTDEDTLTVWSPVLPLPARDEGALFRELLTLNWLATFEAHFAIAENGVVVVATRTVAELSPGEISRAITLVASIADEQDESLLARFGQGS